MTNQPTNQAPKHLIPTVPTSPPWARPTHLFRHVAPLPSSDSTLGPQAHPAGGHPAAPGAIGLGVAWRGEGVDGNLKSQHNQLRLVVYPIIYKVLAPSQVLIW